MCQSELLILIIKQLQHIYQKGSLSISFNQSNSPGLWWLQIGSYTRAPQIAKYHKTTRLLRQSRVETRVCSVLRFVCYCIEQRIPDRSNRKVPIWKVTIASSVPKLPNRSVSQNGKISYASEPAKSRIVFPDRLLQTIAHFQLWQGSERPVHHDFERGGTKRPT